MHIGICKISLRIPENQSLKGKRHVIKSLCTRVQNEFKVSIAEVEDQDLWQRVTLGIACVGNDTRKLNEILSKIIAFFQAEATEFEMLDTQQEIISGF
jgi:uncharacterized protein YlxP (DUF503 family)